MKKQHALHPHHHQADRARIIGRPTTPTTAAAAAARRSIDQDSAGGARRQHRRRHAPPSTNYTTCRIAPGAGRQHSRRHRVRAPPSGTPTRASRRNNHGAVQRRRCIRRRAPPVPQAEADACAPPGRPRSKACSAAAREALVAAAGGPRRQVDISSSFTATNCAIDCVMCFCRKPSSSSDSLSPSLLSAMSTSSPCCCACALEIFPSVLSL